MDNDRYTSLNNRQIGKFGNNKAAGAELYDMYGLSIDYLKY